MKPSGHAAVLFSGLELTSAFAHDTMKKNMIKCFRREGLIEMNHEEKTKCRKGGRKARNESGLAKPFSVLKRIGFIMLIAVGVLLGIFIILLGVLGVCRMVNGSHYRIDTPDGIQEDAYVEIGGIEQFMQIRGEDKNNPVVLWLHGGPGFPLTYMNWYYQGELEKDYTVACLEQRGCGRTYYKNDKNNKAANASPDELLSDIHEAVEYLKKRFHKDKVILMAQSWGTVIGMKYTEQHPENVAAYVGVGQVTQFAKGKLYSAQKAADLAERQGNTRDVERLRELAAAFEKVTDIENVSIKDLEEMILTSGKYLKSEGEMSGMKQMTTALTSPHFNLNDARWFLFASDTKNIIASQTKLINYMYFRFDLNEVRLPENVPVLFVQGDCDYITPTDMVKEYCESARSDTVRMVTIPDAGHTPFLDHPAAFCETVKGTALAEGNE